MIYYLLPVISAGLLILSFPKFNIYYLAWIGLVPFFFSLRATNGWRRFLCGYLFGMIFLGGLLWWITVVRYPASLGYFIGTLLFPLIFGLLGMFIGYFLKKDSPFGFILMPAALWVALEYLFSLGPLALPWWALGNSQSFNLPIAQIATIGGVYAVSFLVVLVNAVVYALVSNRGQRHQVVLGGVVIALGLILLAGFWIVSGGGGGKAKIKVAVIQGGFTQEEKEDPIRFAKIYKAHIKDTNEAVRRYAPDMVIWSETITHSEWLIGKQNFPAIQSFIGQLGIYLVAGVYLNEGAEDYNSVVVLSPKEGYLGRYDKMHLVPFGEYMPLRERIGKIPSLSKWVDKNVYESDTTPGRNYKVFDTKWGKFSVVICFESVFPQISRKMVQRGAELLMVLTNDAWFKRTHAAYQHVAMDVFRAIENRRYVIQGANSGISVIIDPYGRRLQTSKLFARQIIQADIFLRNDKTIYTRIGDAFCWLLLAISAVGIASAFMERFALRPGSTARKKKKSKKKKKKD